MTQSIQQTQETELAGLDLRNVCGTDACRLAARVKRAIEKRGCPGTIFQNGQRPGRLPVCGAIGLGLLFMGLLSLPSGRCFGQSYSPNTSYSGKIQYRPDNGIEDGEILATGAILDEAYKSAAMEMSLDPRFGQMRTQTFRYPGASDSVGTGTNLGGNGVWLVGYSDQGGDSPYDAMRVNTITGEWIDLGSLGGYGSFARDVSSDGSVVVGSSWLADDITEHAFLWDQTDGMVDLGSGNGPNGFSRAFGVSGDGSVLVGASDFFNGQFVQTDPFVWTVASGFQDLGFSGCAYAVTADGSVVVGQQGVPAPGNNATAFLWTQAGGMQDLGLPPGFSGDPQSVAVGVSDDGQTVVGTAGLVVFGNSTGFLFDPTCRAFVWTAATGMQDLNDVLANAGVDLTGITLIGITGISFDGQYVSGVARTPQNDPDEPADFSGFIVQLP